MQDLLDRNLPDPPKQRFFQIGLYLIVAVLIYTLVGSVLAFWWEVEGLAVILLYWGLMLLHLVGSWWMANGMTRIKKLPYVVIALATGAASLLGIAGMVIFYGRILFDITWSLIFDALIDQNELIVMAFFAGSCGLYGFLVAFLEKEDRRWAISIGFLWWLFSGQLLDQWI